jgi:hypothetical protein
MQWFYSLVVSIFCLTGLCVSVVSIDPVPYPTIPPCSGKDSKLCGEAVGADKGCQKLGGICFGEILSDPYAMTLDDGEPSNNYKVTGFFAVCHYQFACKNNWIFGYCVRGDQIGESMIQRVESGGDCVIRTKTKVSETQP